MNRQAILRKARALRRLAENPAAAHDPAQAAEATRARALLERLQKKYKLSDFDTRDPDAALPPRRWAGAPISCPPLLVDFVAAVISAAGGGAQPSVRGTLVVVGPALELQRLIRLAERTALLLQTETADRARLAQAMRVPFDAPSLWVGIAQGLVQRLMARAGTDGGGSGAPRRGDSEPGPTAAAAERRAEETPSRALVLYQPPPKRPEMPYHQRRVEVANAMDLRHGHQVANRFQFDLAGDLPVPVKPVAWRPPGQVRETPAQGFARAEAWLEGVGASIGDNPIVTAYAGAVIGGLPSRDATREYAGVVWEAWRQLGVLVRREGLTPCCPLLQPEVADPRSLVLASMCGEDDAPLRAWCAAAAPRLFALDAAIEQERRECAEAEKARREAEVAEDLKRWAERQTVETWPSWHGAAAPRPRAPESRGPRVDPVIRVDSPKDLERFKEVLAKQSREQQNRALGLMDSLDRADAEAEARHASKDQVFTNPGTPLPDPFDFEALAQTVARLEKEQLLNRSGFFDARIAEEIRRRSGLGRRG